MASGENQSSVAVDRHRCRRRSSRRVASLSLSLSLWLWLWLWLSLWLWLWLSLSLSPVVVVGGGYAVDELDLLRPVSMLGPVSERKLAGAVLASGCSKPLSEEQARELDWLVIASPDALEASFGELDAGGAALPGSYR